MTRTFSTRRRWLAVAVILGVLITAAAVVALRFANRHEFVEYPMHESKDMPTVIAAAPDGAVWFTIDSASAMGRIHEGKLTRLPKPTENLEPIGLAVAADGSAWYTDGPARQVARMTPDGQITAVTLDTPIARLGQHRSGAGWRSLVRRGQRLQHHAPEGRRAQAPCGSRRCEAAVRGCGRGRRRRLGDIAGRQSAPAHRHRRQHAHLRHPHARERTVRHRGRRQGRGLVPRVPRQQAGPPRGRQVRGVFPG